MSCAMDGLFRSSYPRESVVVARQGKRWNPAGMYWPNQTVRRPFLLPGPRSITSGSGCPTGIQLIL